MGYRGSESYLSGEQRQKVEEWIGTHETVSVEEVRDYIEAQYGVVYRSKQSYSEFLEAGGMSDHRTEPGNPKHDEAQVVERREEIKKNWRRGRTRLSGAN
jgi:transposase